MQNRYNNFRLNFRDKPTLQENSYDNRSSNIEIFPQSDERKNHILDIHFKQGNYLQSLQGLQSLQNLENVKNVTNLKNLPNFTNLKNLCNLKNLQNFNNFKNFKNSKVQESEILQHLKNLNLMFQNFQGNNNQNLPSSSKILDQSLYINFGRRKIKFKKENYNILKISSSNKKREKNQKNHKSVNYSQFEEGIE